MIKHIYTLILITGSLVANAQFNIGLINDKDGFSNLRSRPNANASVAGQIKENVKFVYFPSSSGDWFYVETSDTNGYIHKSRIKDTGQKGYFYKKQLNILGKELLIREESLEDSKVIYCVQSKTRGEKDILLRFFKNQAMVKSYTFKDNSAVGGRSGIVLSKNVDIRSIIISKYGNYDGKLIFFNVSKGAVYELNGGDYHIDKGKSTLITFWDSDIMGVSLLNYQTGKKEEIEFEDVSSDQNLYFFNKKYFISDGESGYIRELNLENQTFLKTSVSFKEVVNEKNKVVLKNSNEDPE